VKLVLVCVVHLFVLRRGLRLAAQPHRLPVGGLL
jgi:hypothetical protein